MQAKQQTEHGEIRRTVLPALTLVEVLIVVAILGILAAVIIPEYKGHTQRSKEACAKENLQMLRSVIERYAVQNGGVPPGYAHNDRTYPASFLAFNRKLTFVEPRYLPKIPTNPFNGLASVTMIGDGEPFPAGADGLSGWIYKAETKEIRLNQPGTDSHGKPYFEY